MACQAVSVSPRSVAPASKQSLARLVLNIETRLVLGRRSMVAMALVVGRSGLNTL